MILSLEQKIISGIISLLVVLVGLFVFALHERSVGRDNYIAKIAATQVKWTRQTQAISEKVITKYIHDTQVIREKGDTIIRKVPVYVTVKDDSACTINTGFVSLWNAANSMQLPNASTSINGSPSSVVLSDVAAQHIAEAKLYYEETEKLKALQDWIRQVEAIK